MEEFAKIVSEIERVMDISEGCLRGSRRGRLMLAHMVREGHPHLMRPLSRWLSCDIADIHRLAFRLEEEVSGDVVLLHMMREIEAALGMPPFRIKKAKGGKGIVKCLGFNFTAEEEIARLNAMRESARYMDKLCSEGVQPLAEGCVMTRRSLS